MVIILRWIARYKGPSSKRTGPINAILSVASAHTPPPSGVLIVEAVFPAGVGDFRHTADVYVARRHLLPYPASWELFLGDPPYGFSDY